MRSSGDHTLKLWDIGIKAIAADLTGHEGDVSCFEFTSASNLVSLSTDLSWKSWYGHACVHHMRGSTALPPTPGKSGLWLVRFMTRNYTVGATTPRHRFLPSHPCADRTRATLLHTFVSYLRVETLTPSLRLPPVHVLMQRDVRAKSATAEMKQAHAEDPTCLAMFPDTSQPVFASGGHDGTVKLWDLRMNGLLGEYLRPVNHKL